MPMYYYPLLFIFCLRFCSGLDGLNATWQWLGRRRAQHLEEDLASAVPLRSSSDSICFFFSWLGFLWLGLVE